MGETTGIAWTQKTWNPWQGCHKVSPGCKNCYMFSEKKRYGQNPDVVVRSKNPTFSAPLKWNDPSFVFTCSWSDWLVEEADPWRHEACDVIRRTPHTYQALTKRIERAAEHWEPLPNAWLGVSVEDRRYGLPRIDKLREIPAALRFLSIEPQLEDLGELNLEGIGWVIVGGESGHAARTFQIEWAWSIVEQCRAAGVPCFVKQLGARPSFGGDLVKIADHKGSDPEEWPEDLRVQQVPPMVMGLAS